MTKTLKTKIFGLNIVLVPANMTRLSFGPVKKKLFLVLQNFLFFKIVPLGTIFRNKFFCRDQKLQNGSSHHVPRMQIITKMGSGTILKNKILQGPKTKLFFLQRPKLKRVMFAEASAIFKPKLFCKCTEKLNAKFDISIHTKKLSNSCLYNSKTP